MRHVIYGAGAIGGSIGARLFQSGREVVLIARGAHLQAIQRDGLVFRTAEDTVTLPIPAAGSPAEIDWRGDEVVFLTMKSQDTEAALQELRAAAGDVPVICAQNGVANERMAARIFSRVYAMLVVLPATHLTPGEVILHSSPIGGCLDAGCYPQGTDALIGEVCADLEASNYAAAPDSHVMRIKHTKLLNNLGNIVQALCGDGAAGDIIRRVRDEAIKAYEAAGIEYAPSEALAAKHERVSLKPIPGLGVRAGGSTWQSLERGGTLETDWLNGEIALLGALHGVPTPFNRMLQLAAVEAARESKRPGAYTVAELMARVAG
ncbi:MAG: 2-dehydropantoate 2-reductase N-terminal domain-containing protein [Chloroflexota bacterium]